MNYVIVRKSDRRPLAVGDDIEWAEGYDSSLYDVEYRDIPLPLAFNVDDRDPLPVLATEEQVTSDDKVSSLGIVKQWFINHPAAIDFIRLSPTEQEAQIDAMDNTQLKGLVKYLTIAVAALVKERYL